MKSNNENFIQINNYLLSSLKLTLQEKVFLAYIIGWQKNGKVCYETNASIGKQLGITKSSIRYIISSLNKFDFFRSTQYGKKPEKGSYTSTHTITVDEDKLSQFLASPEIPTKNPKKETVTKSFIQELAEVDDEPNTLKIQSKEDFEAELGEPIQHEEVYSNDSLYLITPELIQDHFGISSLTHATGIAEVIAFRVNKCLTDYATLSLSDKIVLEIVEMNGSKLFDEYQNYKNLKIA